MNLVDNVFGSSEQDILGRDEVHIEEKDKNMNYNVKQCLYQVADGYFRVAVKVSGSSRVAPIMDINEGFS